MAEGHGLHVEFFIDSKQMEFKSEQAGRPIFEDAEFVKIMIPGDRNSIIEREAGDQDRGRFPLEYARFKNGLKEEMQASGSPLKEWPPMSRSLVKEFAHFNVHTVEQLAGMSDTAIQAFGMGARDWSVKAKAFLDVAGNTASATKYATENEALKQEVAAMKAQFAELSARVGQAGQIEQASALAQNGTLTEKRGPGRPRRPENAVHEMTEAL